MVELSVRLECRPVFACGIDAFRPVYRRVSQVQLLPLLSFFRRSIEPPRLCSRNHGHVRNGLIVSIVPSFKGKFSFGAPLNRLRQKCAIASSSSFFWCTRLNPIKEMI